MIKVPSENELNEQKRRWTEIHRILKEDAKRQLEDEVNTPARKNLLRLLIEQKEFIGDIDTWRPSFETKQKLSKLGLVEDQLITSGESLRYWLAEEVKNQILDGNISNAIKLIDDFDPNIIETLESSLKNEDSVFYRSGDIWFVKFQGKWATLKDSKRLCFVVYLIDNPYKGFWVHELTQLVEGQNLDHNHPYAAMSGKPLQDIGLSLVELTIEDLSKDDKDNLENVVFDLWERLKASKASEDRQKRLEAENEWSSIKKLFIQEYGIQITESKKYGLSFTLRPRLKKEAEKARSNVTKNITNALKSIKKEIPALFNHLHECIETGKTCSYNPRLDRVIDWHIRW
jgi:hypothetical protein